MSHYQASAKQLIERMIPQYNASKTMKHTDITQLLLRNLLLVGLRHKDVLKQCQNLKSDVCTADHRLNLSRQAEYKDTTSIKTNKNSNNCSCSFNCPYGAFVKLPSDAQAHTLQDISESLLYQINQKRQKTDQQNGSSSSRRPKQCRWCGGPRLCRR